MDTEARKPQRKTKPRCTYGVDTCDGPSGTSGFICRDCADDVERDKEDSSGRQTDGHLRAALAQITEFVCQGSNVELCSKVEVQRRLPE